MKLSIQERLKGLRKAHRDDSFSDPEQAALAFICKRLKLNYKKWLRKISEKSDLLKNPNPQWGRK